MKGDSRQIVGILQSLGTSHNRYLTARLSSHGSFDMT